MSDGRRPRRDPRLDPVFEQDDWAKGFDSYKRYIERLKRERDAAPDQNWEAYKAREVYRAEQAKKARKAKPADNDITSDEEDWTNYAEVMAKYKREFKLFIMGKIEIPPKKPPWMRDRNADKGSGMGDHMKGSDDELSISDNESLGSVASTDRGPPPSVPSWARSKGSSRERKGTV